MERDSTSKLGAGGGEGFPPSGRFSPINVKAEPSEQGISPPPALAPEFGMFSHDLSRMHDTPPKKIGHRRAHSEILTLPDDINFDSDLGVVGVADGPSLSDETEEDLFSMYIDMDKVNSSSPTSACQAGEPSSAGLPPQSSTQAGPSKAPRIRHQHSQSMDGSTTIKAEMFVSGGDDTSSAAAKKAISAAKLSELALIDPKRAKRILANRQSAARSKERKLRYIAELELKLQTLQTESTSMSAQLTLLQRDTNGLSVENNELKLRLQTTEQQINLQDALNNALKEEIQHLRRLTGQSMPNGGGPMINFPSSFGASQPYYPKNQVMQTHLATQQLQQLQIHSQKQQQHQFQQQQQPLSHIRQQQMHQQLLSMLQQEQSQNQHAEDIKLSGSIPSTGLKD